jgi:tRNA A-37 threonylcarbamoyl transferase component Bud32
LLLVLAGLWIRLGGPQDITAKLGTGTFLLGGMGMVAPVLLTFPGWSLSTAWLAVALARIPRPLAMTIGWDFLSRFPHRVAEGVTVRILRGVFYSTGILLWAALNFPVFAELARVPYPPAWGLIQSLGRDGPFLPSANAAFDGFICAGACYVLVRNYRLLIDPDSRRRIRLAAASFGMGAVSVMSLRLIQLWSSVKGTESFAGAAAIAESWTTIALGFIPVAFAYAVVKHRVLGVRLVIRRGLQYLLARNVLRLILLVPALIVLVQIVREPNRTLSDLVFRSSWRFYLLVMGTAALSLRYRHEVSQWLDRRFFRIALQEENIWVSLTESIRTANTENEIGDAISQQMQLAMPVEGVRVFFRSDSDGELRAIDSATLEGTEDMAQLIESHLVGANVASTVAIPASFWNLALDPAFAEGRDSLIVPFAGAAVESLGAMILGPKKSEQPYTRKERELLQAIAGQVVMACEVLRLKRNADRESRQRVAVLGRLERETIQLLNECLQCGKCFNASRVQCPADGSALQLTLPVERIILGRYQLNQRLGGGGMGVVYEALDLRLNKLVAVKIMVGELFGNDSALVRFKREARAVASLQHPNVVGMRDFGQLPAGGAFIVMDLVRGVSWRVHLRSGKPLIGERVAGWVENLCAGVAAAHALGIVHRDLKPDNVMISEHAGGEVAMVLDFGVAKWQREFEPETNVSLPGRAVGTRSYMSPEQRAGESVETSTDIYSIAVMTLETLAGLKPPTSGATIDWVGQALQNIALPDSRLAALFYEAVAEAPDKRFKRADELGRELSSAIRSEKLYVSGQSHDDATDTLSLDARLE